MTIGKLAVVLGLDSGKFTSGMQKAGKQTKMFGMTSKQAFALAATAAVAVTAAITKTIRTIEEANDKFASMIDAQAKFGRQIGATTQQMRELQAVSERGGMDPGAMNKAIRRINWRVSQVANTGGGAAKGPLERLNLQAEELNKLDPVQKLQAIADAMQNIQSAAERSELIKGLADVEGFALLPIIENGAEGITEQIKIQNQYMPKITDQISNQAEAMANLNQEIDMAKTGSKEYLTIMSGPIADTLKQARLDFWQGMNARAESWANFVQNVKQGSTAAVRPRLLSDYEVAARNREKQERAAQAREAAAARERAQQEAYRRYLMQRQTDVANWQYEQQKKRKADNKEAVVQGMKEGIESTRGKIDEARGRRADIAKGPTYGGYQAGFGAVAGSQEAFAARARQFRRDATEDEMKKQTKELQSIDGHIEDLEETLEAQNAQLANIQKLEIAHF